MRLTIAYYKITKQNLVLINNDTYQRETLSERPIRQPLMSIPKMKKVLTCVWNQLLVDWRHLAQNVKNTNIF